MSTNGRWTASDMPNLKGKVAIVTGANSGIGLETTRELARQGAHVVMACRNGVKGNRAAREIRADIPQTSLEIAELDLASLDSIRRFAETFGRQQQHLHLLINNAGVMALPYRRTADGFEMQFGVNHLGHFALTGLLMDHLLCTKGARVVTVSSGLHRRGGINFDDMNGEQSYDKWQAYGSSKLANLLFAYELQRRLAALRVGAISVAAHPGWAATNLQYAGPEMEGSRAWRGLIGLGNRLFAQSAAMGALPVLYAATVPDVVGCDYIGPGGLMESRGYPTKVQSSAASYDEALAHRLWDASVALTGVTYEALRNGGSSPGDQIPDQRADNAAGNTGSLQSQNGSRNHSTTGTPVSAKTPAPQGEWVLP